MTTNDKTAIQAYQIGDQDLAIFYKEVNRTGSFHDFLIDKKSITMNKKGTVANIVYPLSYLKKYYDDFVRPFHANFELQLIFDSVANPEVTTDDKRKHYIFRDGFIPRLFWDRFNNAKK